MLLCLPSICFSHYGTAVSYTHLDVYKRQELGITLRVWSESHYGNAGINVEGEKEILPAESEKQQDPYVRV